jgi:hypothetical protein
MRMALPGAQGECACGGACDECRNREAEATRGLLQTKRVRGGDLRPGEAPQIVHEALGSAGRPLDAATRAFMEPRFGHDFSRVRVHSDARAVESARAIGALAYTVGEHVAFAAFDPASSAGRTLIAHELAHVLQQRAPGAERMIGLQRRPDPDAGAGWKEAVFDLTWIDDDWDFSDAIMLAVSHNPGFRGVPHSSLAVPLNVPIRNFFRENGPHVKQGTRIKVRVRGFYDPDDPNNVMGLSRVSITKVEPAAAPAATPAQGPTPPKPPPGGRFATDPAFREVMSILEHWYSQGHTGGHVVIQNKNKRFHASSYSVGPSLPEGRKFARPLGEDQAAGWLSNKFDMMAPFDDKPDDVVTGEIDFEFKDGEIVTKRWDIKHGQPPAPAAASQAARRRIDDPQTLDDCDATDTRYGECLHKVQQANVKRSLEAAHDVAEALLDPTVAVPGMAEAKGLADLYKLYRAGRKTYRAVRAAEAAGQEVRAVDAVRAEIQSLGAMDDASRAMLENDAVLRQAMIDSPLAADALKLCKSSCLPPHARPAHVKRLNQVLSDARKAGMNYDVAKLKAYLHAQPDEVSLSEAIDALGDTAAAIKERRIQAGAESLVDVAELMTEQGVREAKPTDVRLQEARVGQRYDVVEGAKYPANQVPIRDKGGKLRRLDSLDPDAGEIISRKSLVTSNGQIAHADAFTILDYFQEFALKYPDGAIIEDVPSTRRKMLNGRPMAGQTIKGRYVLEVPPQKYAIPDWIIQEASSRGITIRDSEGKVYWFSH